MIVKKKVRLVFNKKNLISTAHISIPSKAIKLLGLSSEEKMIKFEIKTGKIIITKNGATPLIVEKNNGGKNTTFRLTFTKEIIAELDLLKNVNITIDYNNERIIIKKLEESAKLEQKIISIINFKGGVGKTTTTHSVGAGLTLEGYSVLLVDIDPQASLTFLSCQETPKSSIKDVLVDDFNINKVIIQTKNYDILPSNLILSLAERQLNSKFGTEKLLKKALEKLEKNYDYVIIDCPPAMNLFTINALFASDSVIIPCETELLAMEGLGLLVQTIKQTEKELDINIKNIYVLPTMIDNRKKLSKEILEHLKKNFKTTKTSIRTCSKLSFLGLEKKETIFEIDKACTGSKDYKNLVEEIKKWDY